MDLSAPHTQQPRQFNPSAISFVGIKAPVTRADISAFKGWAAQSPFPFPNAVTPVLRSLFVVGMLAVLGLVTVLFGVAVVGLCISSGTPNALYVGAPLAVLVTLGILAFFVWLIAKNWRFNNPWEKWLRLSRFCAENGLFFLAKSPRPPHAGTIFGGAAAGFATDRFVSQTGRRFEIGNYDTGNSTFENPVRVWGYMAIGLERMLPHMVLKATKNARRRRGIPGVIDRTQVLSLEGDFNKHFTLYAPRQYERDALYVFAPDLMALMIDEVSVFEVEIVDDWIFFYSPTPFDLTSRRTLRRLFRIARVVGAKTFRQTDRYWDDRIPTFAANEVAPQGRRLVTRISVVSIIVTVLFVGLQLLRFWHAFN